MSINVVGLIEKFMNDVHTLSVSCIKDYQQENKER